MLNEADDVTDQGTFTVNNFYLEPETDLNKLLQNAKFVKIKPHLIRNNGYADVILDTDPLKLFRIQLGRHVKTEELIGQSYYGLIQMLSDARVVTDKFYLTPQDIQSFDFTIPVYIQKYGRYFYVNKIKNFIAGRLTECELVRL